MILVSGNCSSSGKELKETEKVKDIVE